MPSRQSHRGQHQQDAELFGEKHLPLLRQAVDDLSLLLTRGYSHKSSLKLVGDRYALTERQRRAVGGASCSEQSMINRRERAVALLELAGHEVFVDGYNLLIGVESALSGGILVKGRDGCIRDLASIHGSYKRVEETVPAIRLIGKTLEELKLSHARWYFDSPVSNSGRLKTILAEEAESQRWDWDIRLHTNPDKVLAESTEVVVTADSWILDRAAHWANIAEAVVASVKPKPRVIDLGGGEAT